MLWDDLEFRCLVTDDYHEWIDAIAYELNARVRYFEGSMNVLYIMRAEEFLGYVWVFDKDFESLKKTILEVLNAYGGVEDAL